ncbi:uncharacterized protein LOC118411910 isoform X2 [Branchiostoma floridae]|uniref:Uncharacterized protein LOC118411910 isoform X2 n=1 Tax=Branchiostoma floridae TaxID=7739 RepID=A0A9J7KUA7_BRAFL|nr:uncharacterized protein LOC118411910 isoform X2 [Branchiostoma floridae]
MYTVEDKLDVSASSSSSSAGIGPTLSVARPSPAQSNTDVSKYAEELIKDPTVLRSATSISKMFKGGSKNNVTTIFAKNLIESATSDLQIEIESCSSMSSGSCESGVDMMDSVLNITGLIQAEKTRIKGECSREDLGLLSQITKFKPISRETTETHQRGSTHELVHRRDSKGAATEHLHKSQSITTMADVRQGKIRTASGKTLRIRCSKTNEILRQKMIYNARQELAPPKKKKFKTIAKAVAWTVRNRLAFMKGDAPKTKEQEDEEKIQKLAKIFTTNVIKGAVKKYELEERQEAIRQERRRRANRRKFTTTPNFFGELEDFPDPRPWVKKFDKNHNPNNKALTYWVREIQRQEKEHELGPPPPGLDLPCSNLSLRHSKHSDLKLACHAETEEDEPTFSGRKNSSIYFAGITKIGDSDDPQVHEEDKLGMAVGGAPAEKEAPGASLTPKPLLKPSEKTDSPQTGNASKPDYLGGKSGGSNVTREAKGAGMTGLFPANNVPSGKKSPQSGGILKVKDDKKKGVMSSVQKDQGSEMSPALTNETRTQARKSSSLDADALGSSTVDEPVPIWTKAPKEKKSWTTQDKPRDMTDPRVDAPYMLRSLTEVRPDKSVEGMEEPPPAPRSSECLIKGMEGLASASGSSGGTPETEPAQTKRGARVRSTAVADSVVSYGAEARVKIAVQKITVSVTEGLMANNRSLRILNRAVSIINPVVVATEAELFNPTLLGELVHQVNQTYSTMEAATLGLTMFFVEILSGVLARAANLMPLIGATEEGGLPVLPSNAPVDRTDTAASTGNRLLAIRVSPPPSVSGMDDQNATDAQPRSERQTTKLSKGRYPVREQSPGIKNMMPTASMPRKASIPCMKRDPLRPHTAAESGKSEKPGSKQGAKVESDKKRSPPKSQKSDGHEEPEGTIWKVPDRRRRSSLHPEVVEDLKNTLQHRGEDRQEKKQTLHFNSQSSAMSQKSTVTKYGKGKKKDTTSLESSQAVRKTALAFTPPPPPPPLPGCLPGGSAPAQATPVVYTTQTAEVGQRATVSSREQDGTEISTETATMATMVEAQFAAPPAAPPLPPPDYYLSGGDKSDDKTPKAQALLQEAAMVYVPPQFLARFQSKEFRHVEFHPSPRSSVTSSVAGSDVGSVRSSRATSPTGTPRSSSPVGRDHTSQGVQSTALASALRDVAESRDTAHGMMQTQRDSLAFRLQSQATQLKHSTTVRRKTSTGETEDTAEASYMVATVQTNRIPSPPPLPSFGLGLLSAHPVSAMPPLSPVTLGQVLHNAIGRRDHAVPGHMQSGSPGNDSLSFRLQSQATKLKHSTTVRRKTSTGETEDTAEASQVVAAVQAEHIPTPSLPAFGLGAHAQITPPAELAIPGSVPTMGLLSHRPTAPGLPMPQLGGLTGPSLSGGTAMHHTSTSAKVTQKTSVKKGDETVENVAEASQAMATTEVAQIPPPPPLPTPEQLRRPSLPRATPHLMVHGAGFGRVPSPPTLPPMDLLMAGISGGFGRVPSPPALPPMDLLMAGISGGFGRVPSPPALPPMELLMAGISGGFGRPQPNMALQLAGPSVLTVPHPSLLSHGHGQGGGTFMRSTTASNKMTHKTKVTKGDETVENVAEASNTVGTMEVGHIPEPPPLPTPEQLRRPSLPPAAPQLNMPLQMAGPSALATPKYPPSLMSPGQGHGGGTFMRSTTASNKMTHKTKVTKGDEMVENVAEASETVGTKEFGHIPEPPPLPTPEQLRRPSLPQATPNLMMNGAGFGRVPSPPALPPMDLLMAGISGGFGRVPSPPALPPMELLMAGISGGFGRPQPNMALQLAGPSALSVPQPSLLSHGHGQGGGTFMRSTTASNKMTHKTKVTKGNETVENVAEASNTVGTMEVGHIPEPPPLPTPEQLRRPSLPPAAPQLNMALQMAGPSALATPQYPPSLMCPGQGQGGGAFMRSTTASNKMTHKTKVTKGDESVEDVAEASETVGTMEFGHIPEPPPLPTPEQLRRPSLSRATPHLMMHGAGFELVPSPPALPPMELLMAGITDISGRVPSPPALPTMEFLMSEIRYTSRQVPNPPALPTMEFLMSGISGFPERDASQASPRPLLDLVGSGAMQPVPDPNRQYTVMSMYAAQESTLSQKRTVTHRDEGTEHSTAEEFSIGTKAAVLHTNIPEPPLLPRLTEYFVQKPYDHPQDTFKHQITQTVDRFFRRRELSIKLHQDKEDVTDFLLGLEEDKSQISPEKLEEVRAEANEELAIINTSISELLMTTSLMNVVEDSGSQCSEESLEPGVVVSADDYQTATEWIKSDSKLTINLERPFLHELQGAEQHQLSLCNHTDHGESAWYQCDNNYQVVHGEDTPCCMIDHAHHWTYEPTRFKCGSCNEPLLIKYHIETDSEDDDEKDEGHKKVPVPICNTKKHGHEHTWTYRAIRMTCKQCHVTMVMKMHLESDDEDKVPVQRSVPIHHRAPRKNPRTHTCRIQSRSEDSASQIPLVRKPSQTSERKYPYRQPGEKAYSSGKERPSRSLPKPKVVVTPEMRPQPASGTELASGMAKDQSSAAQGRTSLKNVYIQTAGGSTSPPGSAAGKTGKQSAKGSAEPAAKTQKDTVKGGKAGMMRKEYSKKVWDALVGDVNESRSSKAQATPSKYAKKPDSASKDAATKRSGPKAFTKKDMSSKLKGSQEAGASGTPKKVVVTSKDLPSKPTASTKVASTSSTAKSSPPSKEANPPVTGPDRSGQTKESTQDKKEKPSLEASQKGAIVPKAGPSGDQTAKSAPTKISQATKGVDVKGETPIMRTTALSPRRADMQSTEKNSLKETAPLLSKIPRPVQDTTVKRKDPTMRTTALSPRRTGIRATDKPVKQTSLLPTKIPQPTQGNAVRRKVPTMGTEALSPRCTDIQATDKSVKQTSLSPMKIQQPSKDTAVKRNTPVMDRTPVSQWHTGASQGVPPKSEPMKTIQSAKDSADRPRTPRMESTAQTAGPPIVQTGPTAEPPNAEQSSEPDTSEHQRPYGWVSSGIKKYNDDERARLDAEVNHYWGSKFSRDREKPWWNIEDPEERERARLRQDRSHTNIRRAESSGREPGATSASYKPPDIEKQVKYDVDRSPVMLPGHFGASTGSQSRPSMPGTGLVPKKLDIEVFDSSVDSEDEIDLDKPVSVEDLKDDKYWKALEKKAYTVVKKSMEQLETVEECSAKDETPVQEASSTLKKPSKFSQMFQSRKEKERKREREARERAMEEAGKGEETFPHKSDPPTAKPFYGPPLPPEMQKNTPEKKKKDLTKNGHQGKPTLAASKEKEEKPTKSEPMKTVQSAKDADDRPRTPRMESTAQTAGPPIVQTGLTAEPPNAEQSSEPDTSEHQRPYSWVSSGIKKYNDDERARLDAEVNYYWGSKFSRDREKPWWNIEDPEERERARLRQDRSHTNIRRAESSGRELGATSASYKPPGIEKQVKYDVDRSPVMLPGHFGASTGVRSRPSMPGTGLVPKKLDMEVFDSSEDSEDEIDLDKPVSAEDLKDDEYWKALEKKAYTMVKKSMEQLETVEECSAKDETPVQEASSTVKKPFKFSQMFQSRKEKERKREREARERAMEEAGKGEETFPHKSDPPTEKTFYGPPLPPEMQKNTSEKKKKDLSSRGHQGKPTLAASKAKEEEPSTSKKSGGTLTPTKLVRKMKVGVNKVKNSIESKLSGEESDSMSNDLST